MQEELKVTEQLEFYFNVIKEYLVRNKIFMENELFFANDEKTLQLINDKIYDYIMTKLYGKLYPPESDKLDNLIFSKCIILSWTEPKNFIKEKKKLFIL